ncbi:hypothetical protein [Streptomyces sp. NRRL B-24572]|uniref:hypothetical protein n=1 Tax=Streptomyces sp. NRRL B-24572 TaxID=1962156 RepID=UPI000A36DF48|nr:hypothetical protein [Streptomyces sp. NRRL B-24572]
MGIFDKLVGANGGSPERPCPDCGKLLQADPEWGEGRYECRNDDCYGWGVYFDEGGVLVDPRSRGKSSGSCGACQSSLSGGDSYLPYESGGNSYAYIKCPSCGYENIRDGFGEDD